MSFQEESKKRIDKKFDFIPYHIEEIQDFLASEISRFADEAIERMEKEKQDAINRQDEDSGWDAATFSNAQDILTKMKS